MDLRFAVLRHLKALDYRDVKDAADWLHDDLVFHTSIKPLNKEETLDLFDSIFDAFPDWEILHDDLVLSADGSHVHVHLQMKGTHTNTLILNMPGMKPIAATNKKVVLPRQKFTYRVVDDKVLDIVPEPMPEGGLFNILKQIDAKTPALWWLKIMWRTPKTSKKKTELAK